MHRFLPALLLMAPAFGQFSGLATTNDGSKLYFSSLLQIVGSTNENSYEKIFYYDGANFHLFAQRSPSDTNFYHLEAPYVSGNGAVTGYQAISACMGIDASCDELSPTVTTLFYPGSLFPSTLGYGCTLSKNAQYALCQTGAPGPAALVILVNMATGASTQLSDSCLLSSQNQVASNGTALQVISGHLNGLVSASGQTTSLFYDSNACPLISDDGSTIVASNVAINVATGVQTPLSVSVQPLSISNDGSLMLGYTPTLQLMIVRTDGSGSMQLTSELYGIQTATLSGDGSTVYAVTSVGALWKIATATGTVTQLAGPTTQITSQTGSFVPGSQVRLQGAGLSESIVVSSGFPLTAVLGGVQVTLNGQAVPLLSVSPEQIVFQVPWETPLGPATLAVQLPGVTPQFAQSPPFQPTIEAIAPWVLSGPYHQDFSAPISLMYPAQADEIVQFYLSGLGPVTPPIADGIPAPASPLSVLSTPLTLISDATQPPCRIYYQGLAPGLVGIYQLAIQLPTKINAVNTSPLNPTSSFYLILEYGGAQTTSLTIPWALPN
jgi:uncharacterized protein (TIGR03437 family)